MGSKLTFPVVGAQHAASLARDFFNAVREVNEWRHERDAFVAMYMDESRRRRGQEATGARARDARG